MKLYGNIMKNFIVLFIFSLASLTQPIKAQDEHCDFSLFLWVEQPTIDKYDANYFPDFYTGLSDFVTCNAAKITFNKVIVRILDPGIPYNAFASPWIPSATSPFITDLIMKLPAGVEVFVLPYVKEPQYPWTWMPGQGNSIDQAVYSIAQWNTIIAGIDPTRTIKGIAFDAEGSGIAKEDMVCQARQAMATNGISIKVGLTLAGKAINDAVYWGGLTGDPNDTEQCKKVDESYLQVYNLYTQCGNYGPTIYVDGFDPNGGPCTIGACVPSPSCGSSIYLEALGYPSPADAVFDGNANPMHTFKGILTVPQMNWQLSPIPVGSAKHVFPMFTVEAMLGSDCLYPNANDPSKCGQVDGFGTWTAPNFMKFLDKFADNVTTMIPAGGEAIPKTQFGIFQYSFIPKSWIGGPCDYGCAPLPLSWLNFKAEAHEKFTTLSWQTNAEVNNDFFVVEKSDDGIHYYTIGVVKNKNSNQYYFDDESLKESICYYRIRQVDVGGQFSYSKVVSVKNDSMYAIQLSPNPTDGIVELSFNTEGYYSIEVFSVDGKRIVSMHKDSKVPVVKELIDLTGNSKGVYFIKLQMNNYQEVFKVEKW